MKAFKLNETTIGGFVSQVNLQQGDNQKWFGSISLALEDNYQKDKGKPEAQWVDRTHFIEVTVDQYFLNSFDQQISAGDQIILSGKLIQDHWNDKTSGAKRSAQKVKGLRKVSHMTKAEWESIKSLNTQQKVQDNIA